jgi:hypothetical protein
VKGSIAATLRDESLEHIDTTLRALPDPLPLNSQDLPKLLLAPRKYELTQNHDAITLLAMLKIKHVTTEEVIRAFLRRAALAKESIRLSFPSPFNLIETKLLISPSLIA